MKQEADEDQKHCAYGDVQGCSRGKLERRLGTPITDGKQQLFRNFEVIVVDPTCPWKETNSLAFRMEDFFVQLFPRQKPSKDSEAIRS
jgi:hypothetical protein